jgi:hypothetical protein
MPTDDITARLATLERAHRRLRRLVGVLILALLATLLLGAATDGVLVGRTLKLLDEQGRLRVLVTASTGISFVDTKAARAEPRARRRGRARPRAQRRRERAILNVNRDGPALTLIGNSGALRAVLALVSDQPGLAFFDGEEHERARIGVVDGNGRAFVRAADGGMTWRAPNHD